MEVIELKNYNQNISSPPNLDGGDSLKQRLLALQVRANNLDVKLNNLEIDDHSIDVDMIDIHYLIDLCSEKNKEMQRLKFSDRELMAIDIEYYMFELANKIRDIEEFLIYENKQVFQ